MQPTISRFTSRVVSLAKKSTGGRSEPAVQRGEGGFADWVIVTIQALREFRSASYRALLDELSQMEYIVQKLDLEPDELPDFTTVCARYQDLKMAVWRSLLRHSADLVQTGSVQAIDATGFDRQSASRHYANRTNYRFKAVKTTALVDCENSVVLDIHCSMKQPHDTQIGPQILERNSERVEILVADKGYDSAKFREYLRSKDIRPVIKHRIFSSLDRAHNARLDDEVYGQRAVVESIFAAIKQRFGETLRARTWFGQFRELVLKAAAFNVISALSH
ncbi:MAG: IS5 family transposase [Halococcoides sp.]